MKGNEIRFELEGIDSNPITKCPHISERLVSSRDCHFCLYWCNQLHRENVVYCCHPNSHTGRKLFRPQRGSLSEALKESTVFLDIYEVEEVKFYLENVGGDLSIKYYCEEKRIPGWKDTYILMINRHPIGFTNCNLELK